MRKKVGIIKRMSCLLLIFLLSINSFAAIVSDNDGSAFITKAEFDALKSSFQAQIDNYNQSIDSKIDGAIASYLAGIQLSKTTDELFFNGNGDKLVIINSQKNSGLVLPWGSINATEVIGKWSGDPVNNNNQHVCGNVRFFRTDSSKLRPGEFFRVDDNTDFKYYSNDWNYVLTVNFTAIASITGSGKYPPTLTPDMYIRWWGAFSGKRNDYVNASFPFIGHAANMTYGSMPKYASWFAWDCTYYWQGSWYNWDSTYHGSYVPSITESPHTEIKWINDSAENKTSTKALWVNWDTTETEFLLSNCDTKATDGYDVTGSNWTVDYPDQHNVTPECLIGVFSGGTVDRSQGLYTKAHWAGKGSYNTTVTTLPIADNRPSPPTSACGWEEPLQKLSPMDPTTIINTNFDASVLSGYGGFGFTGTIHQGLPLYLFKKDGNVEFELNTTGIGGDVIFALKTSPFDCTTTAIHNTPLTTGISNLKLDGAAVTGGDMTLSQGVHKISFDVTGASSTSKVPLFFMFGYPSSLTETSRYVVTLPSTFQFTSMD